MLLWSMLSLKVVNSLTVFFTTDWLFTATVCISWPISTESFLSSEKLMVHVYRRDHGKMSAKSGHFRTSTGNGVAPVFSKL